MPPSLATLPYEVLSTIVESVNFEDVVALARTSRQLQFLEREDNICKRVLKAKLPFCEETIAAENASRGYASALRRIAKRRDAIVSAMPFSVAVVGFADDFLYCNGNLCYILDNCLRVLDLHRSGVDEIVISVPGLLREFLDESDHSNTGRFRVLYCNEGIVSCLYTLSTPNSVAYLIAFDMHEGAILLTYELPSTEKIFVRHNSRFLYYGTYSGENRDGNKTWVLQGYNVKDEEWLDYNVSLDDLNGAEIGTAICFEIYGDHFYALSNQTNYDVEEVDWTSFYHCIRFPLRSPSKTSLKNTALDKHMWRRQHREGPVDDRWGSLMLDIDHSTGDLIIVETRREFLFGAGRSQRTYYTTKLVFSDKLSDNDMESGSTIPLANGAISQAAMISSGNRRFENHRLAALTNDPLALTLKPSDNPHWLAPQTRYPRNVHPGDDGDYIFSRTHLRYYNTSAMAFLDLVDEHLSTSPNIQRLKLRVGSRKLDPPPRDHNGILLREASDPLTCEILDGLNEQYTCRPVAFWPPEKDSCGPFDCRLEDLSTIMNPPSHLGNVEAIGDERSFIYTTGGKRQPKALIFVNFDPAIKLKGLVKWQKRAQTRRSGMANDKSRWETEDDGTHTSDGKGKQRETEPMPSSREKSYVYLPEETQSRKYGICYNNDGTENWIWRDRAMYRAIDRGYDFSW